MNETSIIISGFGGQGTLFAGQVLAYAALESDLHVTWIPSYGPEMRGGTANCTVVISDEEIGSPLVSRPDVVIAMNMPSVDKNEPLIREGGYLFVNQSLVPRQVEREGINTIYVPAQELAEGLGNVRIANMVMLGAMLEAVGVLPVEAVKQALDGHIPQRHRKTLPINYQAMEQGAEVVRHPA